MAGITVDPADLSKITGAAIPADTFEALDRIVRGLIAVHYAGDPEVATGRTAAVLSAVYTSAAVRLLTNPTGARSVGLGSANVTFGGSDESVSGAFALTANERADLATLRRRRPTYIRIGPSITDPESWRTTT